jgi:hypothetical protein
MSGGKTLDKVYIDLVDHRRDKLTIEIDVIDSALGARWLSALNTLLRDQYHLEKNYCFLGFTDYKRNGWYIVNQINRSVSAINRAALGYQIDDYFEITDLITNQPMGSRTAGRNIKHDRLNRLHRYFEDLQGTSGAMSPYYLQADSETRWHIRQLNLLCHEFESWALSYRKQIEAPEWQRPSQLMCWINAPRFALQEQDFEHFGIETINRSLGGCYLGVNKAVGKHHWEVFNDEGRDSRVSELMTSSLRSQTEAAGDFDIEWARDPSAYEFQKRRLADFRTWLLANGFDPEDPSLTIGHPKVGQVDLQNSFGTDNYKTIWKLLNYNLDVKSVRTSDHAAVYDYHWSDYNHMQQQIAALESTNK